MDEDERSRMAAFIAYGQLDSPNEPELDELVRLAAAILQAPRAVISLVDTDRCWFKAKFGVSEQELPRVGSFCTHAIRGPDVLVVPDTIADRRFVDSPLVTTDPSIRFYAGAPLRSRAGARIGTMCVLDTKPRGGLKTFQTRYLATLAERAVDAFERQARRA